ncbi:S1 family peptidase [Mycolicibacterium goodii]|uniref:S1 family peptidase n=1 Tax=Mycolicibacterium goodii TaxID=134601 RepID=UPI001BDC3B44|nr:S1 family peptidase [Mycolicibacterium goodii]MBU8820330.1 S1 family peptidase [Mycolicibacterium goodii]
MVKAWGIRKSAAKCLVAGVAAAVALSGCTKTVDDAQAVKSTAPGAVEYQGPPVTTDKAAPVNALAGGIPIYVGSGPEPARCTAGFPLVGVGGIRYYLTAGHCARGEENAPVFADISKLTESGELETTRVEIGRVTDNQYSAEYVYNATDPVPFPDLAVFTANTKTWPAPATSLVGNQSMAAAGFPPERILDAQDHGQTWCWPVAQTIGFATECGDVKWVRENYVGIAPKNPKWADAIGDAYPGTPVWSADYGSGRIGTVGIMSLRLDNGVFVVNATHSYIDNQHFMPDSAIGAKMPEGFVPNPPLFAFPK